MDVLTRQQQWTLPFDQQPADPDNQNGPFVNTTGPRPPAVGNKLVAVPVIIPEKGTTPGYVALSVIAADAEKG